MVKYQGELDSLCGIYAICNAIEYLGIKGEHDKLFKIICESFHIKRYPSLLCEGTYFGELKRAISKCKKELPELSQIKVSYPFWFRKNIPKNNERYWKYFDNLFDKLPTERRCAIIGLTKPSDHWIVVTKERYKKNIHFIGFDKKAPYKAKRRSSLHAGERHSRKELVIDRKELIFFERT